MYLCRLACPFSFYFFLLFLLLSFLLLLIFSLSRPWSMAPFWPTSLVPSTSIHLSLFLLLFLVSSSSFAFLSLSPSTHGPSWPTSAHLGPPGHLGRGPARTQEKKNYIRRSKLGIVSYWTLTNCKRNKGTWLPW